MKSTQLTDQPLGAKALDEPPGYPGVVFKGNLHDLVSLGALASGLLRRGQRLR